MTAFDPQTQAWLERALAGEVEVRFVPQTAKPNHPDVAALKVRNALSESVQQNTHRAAGAPDPANALPEQAASGRAAIAEGPKLPYNRILSKPLHFEEGEQDRLIAEHLATKGVTEVRAGWALGAYPHTLTHVDDPESPMGAAISARGAAHAKRKGSPL